MEARQRPVKDWLTKVRTRQILLPRFQRFETWDSNTAADFLTSIVRNLPVGSTLILGSGGEKPPFISRPIVGAPEAEEEEVNELLLDGQQRLTVLWRSLNDNYPNKTYLIDIGNIDKPEVIGITCWKKNGKKYPLWIDRPKICWEKQLIPFKLLNPDDESTYHKWADIATNNKPALARKIEQKITPLRERVASFNLPFLYLPSNTPKDVAIDVFIKLNTTLVRLTAFDIIVAQLKAATGESLHDLVETLSSSVPQIKNYVDPSNFVLSIEALLQDKIPSQRGYFSLNLKKIAPNWSKIVRGSKELAQFLKEEKIFDKDRLPTESILAPLATLWAEAPKAPDKRGNIRILLRKYLWRSFFTERYDRAVSTAVLQDYRALKKVIEKKEDESIVPCLDQEKYPLPTKEMLIQSRWPKYKDRLARAILLLSIRNGAEDIADGSPLSQDNIQQREYHHLFPLAHLNKEAESQYRYSALNCALVTWRTNRKISAKEPIKYLLESCEASTLGKKEIKRRLKTHSVNFNLLSEGDYDKFLEERARTYKLVIKSLCENNA